MFNSIIPTTGLTATSALICATTSLILGMIVALSYMVKSNYSKNFVISLVLLPLVVQVVIMMVNGNIGTGVAIVGAFSLIRFRSVAGTSKEIVAIFFSMAVGLATGMGYIAYAASFTILAGLVFIILKVLPFGEKKQSREKHLKVTIPEDLDYTGVFDDLFRKYATFAKLEKVKTTNMGSLFELKYHIQLKPDCNEKQFVDELRTRNGNLPIICGIYQNNETEL